ncbi:MAG: choice-of-anchor D domain-containing protein [Pseudomonadota bacterium]
MRRCVWLGFLAVLVACGAEAPRPGLSLGGDGVGDGDVNGGGDAAGPVLCANDDDCPGGRRCDPFHGVCVDCLMDDHCQGEESCIGHACVAPGVECAPGAIRCLEGPATQICNGDGSAWLPEETCDDDVDCTADSCVEDEGCASSPDHGQCTDGNDCTLDSCDPGDGCVHEWSSACGEAPIADATPKKLDFGLLLPGEHVTDVLTVTNLGLGDLEISGLEVLGADPVFSIVTEGGDKLSVALSPPLVVEPGSQATFTLRFHPLAVGEYMADLVLSTNDPNLVKGELVVPIAGESVDTNCIEATPAALDFGQTTLGMFKTKDVTISNCGQGLVPVYNIQLNDETGAFSLESTVGTPMDLDVGQFIVLKVGYFPSGAGAEDTASLLVDNGAPMDPHLNVPLAGVGLSVECPVAVVQSTGGQTAAPLAEIQLIGANSSSPNGDITDHQWTLASAPEGAVTSFWPGPGTKNPKLWVPLVGEYSIALDVWDEEGVKSCAPDVYTVTTIPAQTLYVELIWSTPGDPDESDGAGTDLDLHLVHPAATGPDYSGDGLPDGWYDSPYDCFWGNPSPTLWGSLDPSVDDDPVLLREDGDGAGPEVIAFDLLEGGAAYRIGVVYWDSGGLGEVNARVRAYVDGALAPDTGEVVLVDGDLWEVATASASGGTVSVVQPPEQVIIANYPTPIGD